MNPIESILVVLDRSERDEHVCDKAVFLARLLDANLELFLCDSERQLALKQNYEAAAAERGRNVCIAEATRHLDSVRYHLPLDPSRITTSAWCDSPLYEGICRKVAQAKPHLVLKSPDGSHPGTPLYFSDNDWQLASTCRMPIMFVRGRRWNDPARVGAAIELSSLQGVPLAREIASVASQIHSRTRGRLEILTCAPRERAATAEEPHPHRLAEALSQMPACRDAVQVLEGDADAVLPRSCAERDYDVLVIGALAHREGSVPRVGSLTSKLIDALDCDFILVKAQ
jgi:universal stress protein E